MVGCVDILVWNKGFSLVKGDRSGGTGKEEVGGGYAGYQKEGDNHH